MIYLVTKKVELYKKSISSDIFVDIKVVSEEEGKELYYKLLAKKTILAFDMEATSLDAYLLTALLYGIGDKSNQIMYDWTVDPTYVFENILQYKTNLLGHNLKYDIKIIKTKLGLEGFKLYDTMIAEQRIWMKSGYTFSYADLVQRYCKKAIIKATRNEFIDADINSFRLNASHLYYLKGDLVDLFDIRKQQQAYIKGFKMQYLIYGIEFPLIPAIAKAELTGFTFNVEKWKERIKKDKDNLFETELALDAEVKRLKDYVVTNNLYSGISPAVVLSGQKYNNIRTPNPLYDVFNSDGTTNQDDLFGEKMTHKTITGLKKKVDIAPNNIKWNSKKDIVTIFAALQQPLPTPLETHAIPQLNTQGKLIGSVNSYTVKEDFLLKYLLQKPDTIMKNLIELKIKHSKLEKAISTYGENFIQKINPISGKIHTIFRQCDADTGRFQSGGGKNDSDKYNAQNIPRGNEYRNCFTVDTEKNEVLTADYEGAELVVMADYAKDNKLIELSEGDMHSHMATKCWRNIYRHRAGIILKAYNSASNKTSDLAINLKKRYDDFMQLATTFTVSKEVKHLRDAFKPMTFGIIYGMYAKKAGTTLNISKEEGQVVIGTIKKEIPKTFKMVEKASEDAERQGYVILDYRTNARAWFPNLIRQLKGVISKDTHFIDISTDISAARNIRIQGTQATFVKEATVKLFTFFRKNKIDIIMLSWVHDEIVFQIPLYLNGESDEWKAWIASPEYKPLRSTITGKQYDTAKGLIKDIMEETANLYLSSIKIRVDLQQNKYWLK